MKALIEEYASHNFFEREELFFHEWIALAESAKSTGKILRIVTKNQNEEKLDWDLRLYGVISNESGLYHYLVGRAVR